MKYPSVFVLSDSVGETAELVMKAGLSQFANIDYKIHRVPYADSIEVIEETLERVKAESALIGYTFVDPALRNYMNERAIDLNVEVVDILGPVMNAMERLFSSKPLLEPGLIYKLDQEYFKRIEAIEFAVRYDDGRDPRGISRADVVLLGVSRTSKTPLSQYLANQRLKVANIPLVPEVDPPEELFRMDPTRCIGLKISAEKLNEIRKERLKALGLGNHATYATLKRIDEELTYFNDVVTRIGCQVIDVSNKAVEETANIISHMFREK